MTKTGVNTIASPRENRQVKRQTPTILNEIEESAESAGFWDVLGS